MADRRRLAQIYEARYFQEPGMMRHGPSGSSSSTHRPTEPPRVPTNHVEAKLAAQISEIEKLAGDNRMLSSSHVALRDDLIASEREIQKIREYIRSIETESAIQIRVLMEKIAKMEAEIRAGESLKKEYHRDHLEAQSLVKAREELMTQIKQNSKEIEKARNDIKKLPDLHAELDNLRQEHQRLRTSFQYEKGLNIDRVEKMQVMEKELVAMAREVEMLRTDVSNAENRAREPSPYQDPFMLSNIVHPLPPIHGNGPFNENYGMPHGITGSSVRGGVYDVPPPPRFGNRGTGRNQKR